MKYTYTLVLALFLTVAAHAQSMHGNQQCIALVQEGINLIRLNKFNEALAKFQEAEKADPIASSPQSGRALAFYSASFVTADENVQQYRKNAEELAKAALDRNPSDVVGQEVLRLLVNGPDKERHVPTREARAALEAGEDLYQKNQYEDALNQYSKAFQLDPAYSEPLVYAGDCRFAQGKFAEAETYFRKAIVVDSLNERAWRFLADALLKQGKTQQFRDALIGAISARPSYKAAWDNLADWGKSTGNPFKVFHVKPMSKGALDSKTKQANVVIDQGFLAGEDKNAPSPEFGIWATYGLAQVSRDLPQQAGEKKKSIFEAELDVWDKALKVGRELEINTKRKIKNPGLIQMETFATSGDLKAAIFLLMYREDFRPDFEDWKRANSGAISAFIEKYSLRP
ncbi:MAG TPA: tetratricopeptide repeat protein [Geothrix sp.]|nr:tetratricopeptide repeat protein [Geothrix sp.]